jgi:hypothetical protein
VIDYMPMELFNKYTSELIDRDPRIIMSRLPTPLQSDLVTGLEHALNEAYRVHSYITSQKKRILDRGLINRKIVNGLSKSLEDLFPEEVNLNGFTVGMTNIGLQTVLNALDVAEANKRRSISHELRRCKELIQSAFGSNETFNVFTLLYFVDGVRENYVDKGIGVEVADTDIGKLDSVCKKYYRDDITGELLEKLTDPGTCHNVGTEAVKVYNYLMYVGDDIPSKDVPTKEELFANLESFKSLMNVYEEWYNVADLCKF